MQPWPKSGPGWARCHAERRACSSRFSACTFVARERRGRGSPICIHDEAGPDLSRRAPALSVEASLYGWLSRRAEYKIAIDFTGGHQNESMLAYLFRVLLTSFQPPGRSPEEVVRPASHALPTPSWESTQEDCYRPKIAPPGGRLHFEGYSDGRGTLRPTL